MSVNKFLASVRKVPLDFNNIKEKDEYQVLINELNYKKTKFKKLKFIMYTLSVILITVFSTLLVDKYLIFNGGNGMVIPSKFNWVERGYVEKIICFGSEDYFHPYKEELIFNTNIISDADKEIFINYIEEQNKLSTDDKNRFIIYFVIKDGKDIIQIDDINPVNNGSKTFYFESNLNYSFDSIVNDFENMTGTKLTDEFLNSSVYDKKLGKLVSGIILCFNLNDEGIYVPYYKVIIEGKVYVLNK